MPERLFARKQTTEANIGKVKTGVILK